MATLDFELIGDNTETNTQSNFQSTLLQVTGTITNDIEPKPIVFTSYPDTIISHFRPNNYKSYRMVENTDEIKYIRNLDSPYFDKYEIEGIPRLRDEPIYGKHYVTCLEGGFYKNLVRRYEIYGGSPFTTDATSPNIQGYMLCMFKNKWFVYNSH